MATALPRPRRLAATSARPAQLSGVMPAARARQYVAAVASASPTAACAFISAVHARLSGVTPAASIPSNARPRARPAERTPRRRRSTRAPGATRTRGERISRSRRNAASTGSSSSARISSAPDRARKRLTIPVGVPGFVHVFVQMDVQRGVVLERIREAIDRGRSRRGVSRSSWGRATAAYAPMTVL